MKKVLGFLVSLLLITNICYGAETLTVTPVNPIPAKVILNSTVTGIVYNVHNNSDSNTFTITFIDLDTKGITHTTTCGQLAAGADCKINMTFNPTVADGAPLGPYYHYFTVNGAPTRTPTLLQSLIISGGEDVTPSIVIGLGTSGVTTTTNSYNVTLNNGSDHTCSAMTFGTSNFCEAIPQGQYTASITPATVPGSDALTYDAPQAFQSHITADGQKINFIYQQEAGTDVSTDITAPNLPVLPGTIDITLKNDTKTYEHPQAVGTQEFERIPQGQYTLTAPSYVGTDANTYTASITNPQNITGTTQTLTITYAEVPPSTTHVSTVITAPNLPASQTVDVHCTDGGANTYDHSQAAGTTTYDTMVDGSYTCTSANYTVGPDTYTATLENPYTVDATHTDITIVYSKVIPPGNQYDWAASHLTELQDANVFLVDWGGGSTTAPVTIGTNPPINPWLNNEIETYESGTPTPLGPNAAVQEFPNYIAMGTVTSPNSTVTDQLKTQKLDSSFHYEGNGSGNRGCYFDNSTSINVSMTSQSGGNVGSVPAGTYYIVAGFYQVNVSGQATFYKGTLTITSTGTNTYNVAVSYALDTTKTIGSYVDPSIVKQFTFPATSTVTYTITAAPSFDSKVTAPTLNLDTDSLCGSVWYTSGAYTPEVSQMAAQAQAVKAVNSHTLIASEVFYTIDWSDGVSAVTDDTMNDFNIKAHSYNLMREAQLMETEQQAGTPMAMFLNPDSVWMYQNCSQWYCSLVWKSGITQDSASVVISIPNLQADVNWALDRMQTKGLLTPTQVTNLKANLTSSGILIPPPVSKRTQPGAPELVLVYNWIMKNMGPHIPFGWGLNVYDNNNPLLNPTGQAQSWQTGSATWIHKVNHDGLSPTNSFFKHTWHKLLGFFGINATITSVPEAVNNDATMLANYLKDMNMVGNLSGQYKPDFMYFDKYERDPITSEISDGWAWNGVDWDTYLLYMKDTDTQVNNIPIAIWQMPGASIQVQGATFSNNLAATVGMWVFGIPTLGNDFANWDTTQKTADNIAWTPYYNTSVYFTANSKVTDLQSYLELGAGSP